MDFYDLDPSERAAWYDKAERDHGCDFFDLPPDERASYYERATEPYRAQIEREQQERERP